MSTNTTAYYVVYQIKMKNSATPFFKGKDKFGPAGKFTREIRMMWEDEERKYWGVDLPADLVTISIIPYDS